jgi:hypothetical protein
MLIFITGLLVAFMLLGGVAIRLAQNELIRSERETTTEITARAAAVHWATHGDPVAAGRHSQEFATANVNSAASAQNPTAQVQFGRASWTGTEADGHFHPDRAPFNSVRVTLPTPPSVNPLASLGGRTAGAAKERPSITTTVAFRDRDLVWLIDDSVAQTAALHRELHRAVGVFFRQLRRTPGETWVGLVVDGEIPQTVVPLAAASEQQAARFDTFPDVSASPPTASFAAGLHTAIELLQEGRPAQHVDKTVIVLTARSPRLTQPSPAMSARLTSDAAIIHTVLWNPAARESTRPTRAETRSGRTFQAADGDQLAAIFRQLALTVRTVRIE